MRLALMRSEPQLGLEVSFATVSCIVSWSSENETFRGMGAGRRGVQKPVIMAGGAIGAGTAGRIWSGKSVCVRCASPASPSVAVTVQWSLHGEVLFFASASFVSSHAQMSGDMSGIESKQH